MVWKSANQNINEQNQLLISKNSANLIHNIANKCQFKVIYKNLKPE